MKRITKYLMWGFGSLVGSILGFISNVVAMVANGGFMPVYYRHLFAEAEMLDYNHITMTVQAHLKFLCDWIPLGPYVGSPGDALLLGGFLSFIVWVIVLSGIGLASLKEF